MKFRLVLMIWWLQLKYITCSSKNLQSRKFAENSHFINKTTVNTNKDFHPVELSKKTTSLSHYKGDSSQFKPSYAEKVKKYSSQNDGTMKISTNILIIDGELAKELSNKTENSAKIPETPIQVSNYATCSASERVVENINPSMIAQNTTNEKDVLGNLSNCNAETKKTQKSSKTFSVKAIRENENLEPNHYADAVSKNNLLSNPSPSIRNKNFSNHSSSADCNVLHKINESKVIDTPKSTDAAKRIAIGYETIPDERIGTQGKYLLHSISVYDGKKFIYGVDNIKHPPINPRILKTWKKGDYDNSKPDSIAQVREKIKNLRQDKIVILYKPSFLFPFFVGASSIISSIRDIWCLQKFIHTVRQSELNCQRYKYSLEDFIIYFTSSAEQNMLYSKNNKMTNTEFMARASWILYDKLAIKWEKELTDLFGFENDIFKQI